MAMVRGLGGLGSVTEAFYLPTVVCVADALWDNEEDCDDDCVGHYLG